MNKVIRSSLLSVLLLLTAVGLFACGDTEVREREGMPFMRIRLRNTSPPEGQPASAEATGTHLGAPGPTFTVGPVPPGAEQESQPPGTKSSDAVAVRVTFEGGATFQGDGSYPGSFISTVDIECAEQGGGNATVNFATGQPPENIPLHP